MNLFEHIAKAFQLMGKQTEVEEVLDGVNFKDTGVILSAVFRSKCIEEGEDFVKEFEELCKQTTKVHKQIATNEQ